MQFFLPDDLLLATGGADQAVILWDMHSGKVLKSYDGHFGTVFNVCFTPDGAIVISAHFCVSHDWETGPTSEIHIWNPQTLLSRFRFTINGTIPCFTVSGDGRWLSCSASDTTIVDIDTGAVVHHVPESRAYGIPC